MKVDAARVEDALAKDVNEGRLIPARGARADGATSRALDDHWLANARLKLAREARHVGRRRRRETSNRWAARHLAEFRGTVGKLVWQEERVGINGDATGTRLDCRRGGRRADGGDGGKPASGKRVVGCLPRGAAEFLEWLATNL